VRIDRLDLVRFGHFTEKPISLPHAPRDFHVIIGHNEAGKTTLQTAMLELFFGIERDTTFGFLHPKPELCIGAVLSHGGKVLELRRVKKPRSLLGANGEALPETVLEGFLGGATRDAFRLVFGLDHERLVSGGRQILAAKNDVGKTLLQASGSISHLRDLQQSLSDEADKLWAKRRSGDREYYKAQLALEEAESELKRTTVKAKEWLERSEHVRALEQQQADGNARLEELESERIRLERVRRVAPFVRAHAEASEALQASGQVTLLPADASHLLQEVTDAMAKKTVLRDVAIKRLEEARERRAKITLDQVALNEARRIEALDAAQKATANHQNGIAKQEAKVSTIWETIHNVARQLDWPQEAEAALRARLPPLPVRRSLQDLIKKQGATWQAVEAATAAVEAKQREIADNQTELDQQAAVEVTAELKAALEAATKLGDFEAAVRRESNKVNKAERALTAELSKLGPCQLPIGQLRTLTIPPVDLVRRLASELDRLQTDCRTVTERRDDLGRELAASMLGIEQYRRRHHPVTLEDLAGAREARDQTWHEIKQGQIPLQEAAPGYERQVSGADAKADQRHDGAKEAAELQAKLDQVEQSKQKLADAEARLTKLTGDIATQEAAWQAEAGKLGFTEMTLIHFEEWRAARESVLRSAEALDQAEADAAQLVEAVSLARDGLLRALDAVGRTFALETCLAVLLQTAQGLVDAAMKSQARREELTRQIANGKRALVDLAGKADRAAAAKETWTKDWSEATRLAGLSGSDVAAVDGALTLLTQIEEGLTALVDPEGRLTSMRRDLEDLDRQTGELASVMALDLKGRSSAEVSTALTTRLKTAKDQEREAERLDAESREQEEKVGTATAELEQARVRLSPLLRAVGTIEIEALRKAISDSDQRRKLEEQKSQAKAAAEQSGDGLPLTDLATELSSTELARVPERLSGLKREQDDLHDKLQALSASLATAQAELEKITGGDDAASAATRRQGALAHMAQAAERYIEVRTAERLLGWAIERYREQTQEPLLARASEIFAGLTERSFARLTVDSEADPPKLTGIRPGPDRKAVDTEQMSDGTRDQLFLALRLAALELQIAKGHPLPFIADDLFVNFDDGRARAGLQALARLSEQTQVIFLTHHDHLLSLVKEVLGEDASVIRL
jgi:uncharacterized protein YhaN